MSGQAAPIRLEILSGRDVGDATSLLFAFLAFLLSFFLFLFFFGEGRGRRGVTDLIEHVTELDAHMAAVAA